MQTSTLAPGVMDIVRTLCEDPVADVRAFVRDILSDRGSTSSFRTVEKVAPSSPSVSIFSRPPVARMEDDDNTLFVASR